MFRWLFRVVPVSAALFLLTFHAMPPEPPTLPEGLPPGSSIEQLAAIQWPAEIQCAPDSRCFVATVHDPTDEERSAIWVIQPDGSTQRIYRGPSYDPTLLGEKGLTGLALHPRFAQDDRLFFYWNPPNHSRSSRHIGDLQHPIGRQRLPRIVGLHPRRFHRLARGGRPGNLQRERSRLSVRGDRRIRRERLTRS